MKPTTALPLLAIFMFVAPLTLAQSTQPATWTQFAGGQLILRPFPHAPYPHPSRADGFKDKSGTFYSAAEHYSDSTVGVFLPPCFSGGDTINFIIHFHGHRNHIAQVVRTYNLPEQLVASKVDAVMLFPQGPKDVPDSGCGRMELDEGALKALLSEVGQFLVSQGKARGARIGRVIVTAHSGGYKAASWVVGHGGVDVSDCFLFDASYGNLDRFAAWLAADPTRRLVSFHTKHLDGENEELARLITHAGAKVSRIDDTAFVRENVQRPGAIFISTDLPHDDVPAKRDHFALLLETLGPVPKPAAPSGIDIAPATPSPLPRHQ